MSDIGGALGAFSSIVAEYHPSTIFNTFDLPKVHKFTEEYLSKSAAKDRINIVDGDFFKDSFPPSEVITLGNILHGWGLETKKMLIKQAYDALPENGVLIAIENMIDNERRVNTTGLILSLCMLMEYNDAFDYTEDEFSLWVLEAGFKRVEFITLSPATKAGIAYKWWKLDIYILMMLNFKYVKF